LTLSGMRAILSAVPVNQTGEVAFPVESRCRGVMRQRRQCDLKLHPVVQAFVEEQGALGSLIKLLRDQPHPREPAVQALLLLREARTDLSDLEKIDAAIRASEVVDSTRTAPDLYCMLLCLGADTCSTVGKLAQAWSLLRRAESVSDGINHPDVRAMQLYSRACFHRRVGQIQEYFEFFEQALQSAGEQQHVKLLMMKSGDMARVGRQPEVERELMRHKGAHSPSLAFRLSLHRMFHFCETVQLPLARAILESVRNDPDRSTPFVKDHYVRPCREFMRFIKERWSLTRSGQAAAADPAPGEDVPDWLRTSDCLLARRPREALSRARDRIRGDLGNYLGRQDYEAFDHLRAELACGNAEAARRIIDIRHRRGNFHYLDDLFIARAALLGGKKQEAARHFAAVTAAAARYSAEGRLDLELRMACELGPCALMALSTTAGRCRAPLPPQPAEPSGKVEAEGEAVTLIGDSPAVVRMREAINSFAQLDVPVLITGETGTGKELVARGIHESGPRSEHPFIAINCGAISDNLLSSELFGHARGAFTGADSSRAGIFESAGEGTLLLDEIGSMSERLQASLLRVLESGRIRPVGVSSTRPIGCRVLAATNVPLEQLVREGRFRPDLYYRLRRVGIRLVPLRERGRDAVLLLAHFLQEGRSDGLRPAISASLEEAIMAHDWPGNVREVRGVAERMRIFSSEKLDYDISDAHFITGQELAAAAAPPPRGSSTGSVQERDPGESAVLWRLRSSPMRRLDRLRSLFSDHGKLTRAEVAELLQVSGRTASRYLKGLLAEGFIEKVKPTPSPRSHYFRLRST